MFDVHFFILTSDFCLWETEVLHKQVVIDTQSYLTYPLSKKIKQFKGLDEEFMW